MSVPKAAVDEHCCFIFGQYNIRCARIAFIVLPIAEALGKKVLANNFFRFGILVADAGHIVTSLFGRMDVSQNTTHLSVEEACFRMLQGADHQAAIQ